MARPAVVVECAPGYTPFDSSPVWVDISARVLKVTYSEGREANLEAYPPGEATIVIDNFDRLLDPEYTAGTYFGKLVPRVPFRVRAVSAGPTSRTLFYGFVEGGWQQDWQPPAAMTCTVTLVDWLGVIASYRLDDYLDDFVLGPDTIAWWRFDESRNTSEVVDRSGNDHHGTAVACTQGEAGLTPGAGKSIFIPRGFDPITNAIVTVPVTPSLVLTPPFTICWVARLQTHTANVGANHIVLQHYKSSNNAGLGIFYNSYVNVGGTSVGSTEHGMLVIVENDGTARREIVRSESGFDDNVARFFAVVVPSWNASTWVVRFADLASAGSTSSSATVLVTNSGTLPPVGTPDLNLIGNEAGIVAGDWGLNGNLDHLMYFDAALSTGQIDALSGAIWDYNGNQSTGDGVDWVLDRIGVPAAFRDIDTGDEMLGVTTEFGALERLRGCEAAEQGALYVDHQAGGVIRFRSASNLAADTRITTTQHTLSDLDSNAVFHYEPDGLQIEANGVASIVNRQTVEWAGGTVTVQDDDSVDAYGPREGPLVSAPAENYAAAKAIASQMVLVGKEPRTRVRSLRFDAGADPSNFDLFLDLQPRDQQSLERRPLAIGSPIIQDVYYEGGKYSIGPGPLWDGQLFLSTVPKAVVGAELGLLWNVLVPVSVSLSSIVCATGGVNAGSRTTGDLLLAAWRSTGGPGVTSSGGVYTPRVSSNNGTTWGDLLSRVATNTSSDNFNIFLGGSGFAGSISALTTNATTVTYAGSVGLRTSAAGPTTVIAPTVTAVGVGKDIVIIEAVGSVGSTFTITPPVGGGWTSLGSVAATGASNSMKAQIFVRDVVATGATGTATFDLTSSAGNISGTAARVLLS